jgi:DNA polymerase IV
MASDFSKPNKVHTLFEEEIKSKLWNIPIDQMLWVGNKSSIKLKEININTIGDLANADYSLVYKYFKNQTKKIMNYANGIDNDLVISSKWTPKGISNSTTFEKDLDDKKDILIVLRKLCDNVSISLREQKKYASVISVNIKDEYFKSNSHQRKLKNATNLSLEIYKEATILFNELWSKEPIRLIGIRLDQLSDNSNHQISLFENIEERKKDTKLDQSCRLFKKQIWR